MAVGRRIEDDAVVAVAAARLAPGEFHGVLHHPADTVQAAVLHVAAGPGDDLPDGVQVGHVSAGRLGGKRRRAGVGEEVEHAGRAAFRRERAGLPVNAL